MKVSDLTIEDCYNICLEANKKPCIECPIQELCAGFFKDFPYNLDDVMDDDIDYEPGKPLVDQGDKMTELELIKTLSKAIDFYKTLGSRSITVYIDYRTSNLVIDEVIKKFHEKGYGMKLCIDLYALQKFILINW